MHKIIKELLRIFQTHFNYKMIFTFIRTILKFNLLIISWKFLNLVKTINSKILIKFKMED